MTDYIYALLDPETGQIRYVGKTDNPPERLKNHLNENGKWHRINWLKSLKKRGLKPIMQIIEEVADGASWDERERYWIAYHRSIGTNLTNGSDGGDCGPDCTGMHFPRSQEYKENMKRVLTHRNQTPEMRERSRQTGLANLGRKHTPEEIEKIRISQTGKKFHTEEFKKALAERNKNRKYNHETMRENSRRLWDDPIKAAEARKKLIERNKARGKSKSRPSDVV